MGQPYKKEVPHISLYCRPRGELHQPRLSLSLSLFPFSPLQISYSILLLSFLALDNFYTSLPMEAVKRFFSSPRFAVAGASNDSRKFGYKSRTISPF